jgi:hypothetical protein
MTSFGEALNSLRANQLAQQKAKMDLELDPQKFELQKETLDFQKSELAWKKLKAAADKGNDKAKYLWDRAGEYTPHLADKDALSLRRDLAEDSILDDPQSYAQIDERIAFHSAKYKTTKTREQAREKASFRQPTINSLVVPILTKMQNEEELSPGEQQVLDIWQRKDVLDKLFEDAISGRGITTLSDVNLHEKVTPEEEEKSAKQNLGMMCGRHRMARNTE